MLSNRLITAAALALTCGTALAAPINEPLPITQITLYRSGVGFFQRSGEVTGTTNLDLTFEGDAINDILKSLVVIDYGGGIVNAATYDTHRNAEEQIQSLGFDPYMLATFTSLLKSLEGEPITLQVLGKRVDGRLMSSTTTSTSTDDGESTTDTVLTVLTSTGIRQFSMSTVESFTLADEQRAANLERVYEILAQSNAKDSRTIRVDMKGPDDLRRDVAVGYTHEMPIWKTSYRLVLGEGEKGTSSLQGWAIVENTTDSDWNDVTVSLASGRPIGFKMPLDEPLMIDRETQPVPIEQGVSARAGTMSRGGGGSTFDGDMDDRRMSRKSTNSPPAPPAASSRLASERAEGELQSSVADGLAEYAPPAQGVGETVGEQFIYTIDHPVSIQRQRSAMVPLLTAPLEGRRLSVYNASARNPNPYRGYEFTNDSDLHLLPGPIAVFDAGSYAGDALISHTPEGAKQLIAYALDLDLTVSRSIQNSSDIQRIQIKDGLLLTTSRSTQKTTYRWSNADQSSGRTLVLEEPKMFGWDYQGGVSPTRDTPSLDIFELSLDADSEGALEFERSRVWASSAAVLNANLDSMIAYHTRGKLSDEVLAAIRKAASIQERIRSAANATSELERERNQIGSEQMRLRENLRSVPKESELYNRYLVKLGEQEDRLEAIEGLIQDRNQERERAERELRDYLDNLTVN